MCHYFAAVVLSLAVGNLASEPFEGYDVSSSTEAPCNGYGGFTTLVSSITSTVTVTVNTSALLTWEPGWSASSETSTVLVSATAASSPSISPIVNSSSNIPPLGPITPTISVTNPGSAATSETTTSTTIDTCTGSSSAIFSLVSSATVGGTGTRTTVTPSISPYHSNSISQKLIPGALVSLVNVMVLLCSML